MAEEGITRRGMLRRTAGASAVAASVPLSTSLEHPPEFSIELAVTEDLADLSREEEYARDYTLQLVEEWIDRTVRPLLSDDYLVSVEYADVEPEVSEDPEEALEEWKQVSDTGKSCSLLVTGDRYSGPVGLAEPVDHPMESSAALVGEGYDFLELEEKEWREKVPVVEYEDLDHELNYTPWKTVVAALHEIGHTMGLDHEDGEIHEVEDGVAATVMTASYVLQHADPDQIRYSDDLIWTTSYSERSNDKVERD